MFKKDVIIVKTKNSAAGMRDAVPVLSLIHIFSVEKERMLWKNFYLRQNQ